MTTTSKRTFMARCALLATLRHSFSTLASATRRLRRSRSSCLVPLEWHPGFRLHVDEMALHPSYGGPEYVALGRSLAVDGWLTPAILEMAVRTERHHPQDLKKVWHYLARFGDRSFKLISGRGQPTNAAAVGRSVR